MESLELTRDVCRICLEHKENINWNDKIKAFCEISYKDCYYRYTQLDEPDIDYFPTNLCGRCASKLKDTHKLFEMALESFKILQNTFKTKGIDAVSPILKICTSSEEVVRDEKTHLEIEKVSPALEENQWDEIIYDENSQSYKISLEQQPTVGDFNIELLKSAIDKENKVESYVSENLGPFKTTLELNLQLEIHGSKLLRANKKITKNKAKGCQSFYKTSMTKANKQSSAIKSNMRRKYQHSENIQKSRNKPILSSTKIPLSFFQSPNSSDKQIFDDEQTYLLSDHSSFDLNIYDEDINTEVHLDAKCLNQNKRRNSLDIKSAIKKENQSDVLLEDIFTETDADSLTHLTLKDIKQEEVQKHSVSDKNSRESENYVISHNFDKKDEKSMLKEIFGKDIDIEALLVAPKPKKKVFMCQYCSVKVSGATHFKKHEATHLENRQRNIICTKCGMKFYTKESLNMHNRIHDENRVKKNKCEFCEKSFFHTGALNVHRRIHLGLMVKCQLCPKEFYRRVDLERHLPTHSASALQSKGLKGGKQKKYTVQCQYCNQSVLTTKWRAHKAAHLNEPQVQCKICEKDFFARHSCYRHIKKVHRKTGRDIEDNIHSYVDWSRRMSHLMLQQQESLTPLTG